MQAVAHNRQHFGRGHCIMSTVKKTRNHAFGLCCFIALLLLCDRGQTLHAQTLVRRDIPSAEYVLGAGDQVSLHVADVEELSDKPLRISPSGFLDLPLLGEVKAAGLTASELKANLTDRLRKYVTAPEVSLNVTDYQSRPVSVLGSVNHAGVYQLQGPKRLLEVLSLAGGPAVDAGSTVIVTRPVGAGKVEAPGVSTTATAEYTSVSLPLDDITDAKRPEDNILIGANDTVSIPRAELVYVLGNVRRAGGFTLAQHKALSVTEALSLAEGLAPNANGKHARILRRGPEGIGKAREIQIDTNKILAGKEPDVQLFANDVLFIPNSSVKAATQIALGAGVGVASGLAIYRH